MTTALYIAIAIAIMLEIYNLYMMVRRAIIDIAICIRDITGKDVTIGNLTICAKD